MLMPSTVPSPLPGATTTTSAVVPSVTTTIQPLHQKDTTWTKLFVGGLPYHTTDKSLREHFEVYGDIEEAVVITDRSTGKSRGYGFVIMATKETAERACKEPNPIIDGRKANVNLAILGAKPRGNVTAGLPLTALRPGYPTLLPASQYGELTLAGQLGLTSGAGSCQQLAPAAVSPTAVPQSFPAGAPGKARSSMNLHVMSGRAPVAQATTSPYLQQLYAAASPYGISTPAGFIPLNGMGGTGNPLLDMYGQYAAATAASYPQVTAANISPPIESTQQAVAGGYLPAGYTYAPFTAQQLTAAGLGPAMGQAGMAAAGLPTAYAASAGPTTATVSAQPQPADGRIQ
jgi:hypothetical protein